MFKKKLFLLVDTETSLKRKVIDFAAVIVDRHGKIYNQIAVLVTDYYETETLFYNTDSGYFGRKNLKVRQDCYVGMLNSGERKLASVIAINKWLDKARDLGITLTAYNLAFDKGVCAGSGIDLTFSKEFCLWNEAVDLFASRKGYINYCLQNRGFTAKMNMMTNAEIMAAYITGNDKKEPHTALEDIIEFELPILVNLLRQKKKMKNVKYNWRKFQLKNLAVAV